MFHYEDDLAVCYTPEDSGCEIGSKGDFSDLMMIRAHFHEYERLYAVICVSVLNGEATAWSEGFERSFKLSDEFVKLTYQWRAGRIATDMWLGRMFVMEVQKLDAEFKRWFQDLMRKVASYSK